MTPRKRRAYGWRRDHLDHRDRPAPPRLGETPPPIRVDLRAKCPPVFDQGGLGSCVANAVCSAIAIERSLAAPLSRLFVYWEARRLEFCESYDAGCEIRDALKGAASGVPLESDWPYDDADPGPYTERPGDDVFAHSLGCHVQSYHQIKILEELRAELATGHAVPFGFSVPESFESGNVGSTGIMQIPAAGERTVGGHAVLAIGYDDPEAKVRCRNSWGAAWGQGGDFWMPYTLWTDPKWVDSAWAVRA